MSKRGLIGVQMSTIAPIKTLKFDAYESMESRFSLQAAMDFAKQADKYACRLAEQDMSYGRNPFDCLKTDYGDRF